MNEIDRIIEYLIKLGDPSLEDISLICKLSYEILNKEDNVLYVSSPFILIGDVHGDYDDVLEIFEIFGYPPEGRYLFLGDYVDRGPNSIHTLLLLLCYKIKYPKDFYLIRGNHETSSQSPYHGFYDEVLDKFGDFFVWKCFLDIFIVLPIAIVVDNSIFCVHGGLSVHSLTIEQIQLENRKIDDFLPKSMISDLLWNDPSEIFGFSASDREGGVAWGSDITENFLKKNKLKFIVRGHQSVDGYNLNHNNQVLTVFSALCYHSTIKEGTVLEVVSPDDFQITKFRPKIWGKKLYDTIFPNHSFNDKKS